MEDEDLSILAGLKSSLLSIMAKLLMSLPVETLKEIPGYNTAEHDKAINAYSKIMNCLNNYKELQKKSLSVNETTPQPYANINPLCLSPNEKHYRLLYQRGRENSFESNSNTKLSSHNLSDKGDKVEPVINTNTFGSLRNSTCKKLFQSPSVSSENKAQVQKSRTENTLDSLRNIPNMIKESGASSSTVKCTPTVPHQTNSTGTFKAPQTIPQRKFSFGKHRELESSSSSSPPAGSDILNRLKGIKKPMFSPSGAANPSTLVHGSNNTCGPSTNKSLPNNSGHSGISQPLGKSSSLIHPQLKNNNSGE